MTLITESYRAQNKLLHASGVGYGTSGKLRAPEIRQLSDWGRKRILDYGCGQQTLAKRLGPAYQVVGFDPCIEGMDSSPEPHPVVACTDVLEHIEPECLADVLADLHRVTQEVGFFVVHLTAAKKTLSDGRNAHLIQEPAEWWAQKIIGAGFEIWQQDAGPHEAAFVVKPARAS